MDEADDGKVGTDRSKGRLSLGSALRIHANAAFFGLVWPARPTSDARRLPRQLAKLIARALRCPAVTVALGGVWDESTIRGLPISFRSPEAAGSFAGFGKPRSAIRS